MQAASSASPMTFHCIGSACEDTCCQGWNIPIDRDTWEKYRSLPPGELSSLISTAVKTPQPVTQQIAANDWGRAQIPIDAKSHCPLLTPERLCRIHAELGEDMLSYSCATYPRIVHELGGMKDTALALSCPEAARLVLLNPNLPGSNSASRPVRERPDASTNILPPGFLAIRRTVLDLIRMRSYPLWQRMFLLGLMCRRLDSIARGELNRTVLEFLGDFKRVIASGSLRPAMATLPIDRNAQLDAVLRLAGLMLHRSNVTPRFSATVQAFTSGIGNGPGATIETLSRQYARAHDLAFEPFFQRHPHILENYLANTIVRCQFPFGPDGVKPGATPDRAREFAKLTAQFALVRGLLIGVAGSHGTDFSTAHVVTTVQSAAKHFEHHPEFLKLAHELLLESQMDGARGMAILLREATQETLKTELPVALVPGPFLRTTASV